MATYERVDYGSPDGAQLGGAATDKLGFYGTVPIVKASVAQQTTKTSTALRADLTALQNAIANLGLLTVT